MAPQNFRNVQATWPPRRVARFRILRPPPGSLAITVQRKSWRGCPDRAGPLSCPSPPGDAGGRRLNRDPPAEASAGSATIRRSMKSTSFSTLDVLVEDHSSRRNARASRPLGPSAGNEGCAVGVRRRSERRSCSNRRARVRRRRTRASCEARVPERVERREEARKRIRGIARAQVDRRPEHACHGKMSTCGACAWPRQPQSQPRGVSAGGILKGS